MQALQPLLGAYAWWLCCGGGKGDGCATGNIMVDIVQDARQVLQIRADFMSKLFTHPHRLQLCNHCSDCRPITLQLEGSSSLNHPNLVRILQLFLASDLTWKWKNSWEAKAPLTAWISSSGSRQTSSSGADTRSFPDFPQVRLGGCLLSGWVWVDPHSPDYRKHKLLKRLRNLTAAPSEVPEIKISYLPSAQWADQ